MSRARRPSTTPSLSPTCETSTRPYLPDSKPTAIGLVAEGFVYASHIDNTESLRADNKFADRVRGLHVYGGKVVRPDAVQVYVGA